MLNNVQHFDKSSFDALRKTDEGGNEFWSARSLQSSFGYTEWRKFEGAIERAKIACINLGQNPDDHFGGAAKGIKGGKGVDMVVEDYHLTRYACYLTAMNGDPRKLEIAAAQGYFVAKTREAEQLEEQLKTQLGTMQFFGQAFKLLFKAISAKEIVENKPLALGALSMLKHVRLLVYRAVRDYEALVRHFHGNAYDKHISGDIAQFQIVVHNGELVAQLQFPFIEESK